MREPPERTAPLGAAHRAASQHPAAQLALQPPMAQFCFRGGGPVRERISAALGVTFPVAACRSATAGDLAALWLGPDEWLVLAPVGRGPELERAVAAALADMPYAWVNVGHRNAALTISGDAAADIVNAGCPLNLDLAVFPVSMCTRTVLAHASIILWRTRPVEFIVSAGRSFIPYVWDFLVEARARL